MPEETSNWTDERVELLRARWLEGKSATEIAAELGAGITRNAVIGKKDRLALKRPETQQTQTRRYFKGKPKRPRALVMEEHRQRSTLIRKQDLPPPPPKPFKDIVDTRPDRVVALVDMDRHDCRWPFGDPRQSDFGFCGAPTREGSSYCPVHHRRAYLPRVA